MTFDWYKIINRGDFEALEIPSRDVQLNLEGVGISTVTVLRGNFYSIVFKGVMLSIGITEDSPFVFEGYAVYLDANDDIYLGIEVDS